MKRIILNVCYYIIASITSKTENAQEQYDDENLIDKTRKYSRKVVKSPTGFKGVRQRGDRYQATVDIKDGTKSLSFYIGMYDTPEQASKARNKFLDDLK